MLNKPLKNGYLSTRFLLLFVALSNMPARADIGLVFDVQYKGLKVAIVELDIVESEEKYGIGIGVKTTALAALFSKQSSYFSTIGDQKTKQPISHSRIIEFHGKGVRESDVYWANSKVDDFNVNPADPIHQQQAFSQSVIANATDPLTPLYRIISGDSACTGTTEVFDGRRHYSMSLNETSRDNSGFRCKISIVPISGFDQVGDFDLAGEGGTVIDFGFTEQGAIPLKLSIDSVRGRAVAIAR